MVIKFTLRWRAGLDVPMLALLLHVLPRGGTGLTFLRSRADPCPPQLQEWRLPPAPPRPGPPPLVPAAPPALTPLGALPKLDVEMLPTLGPLPTTIPMPPTPTRAPPIPGLARIIEEETGVDPPNGTVYVRGSEFDPGEWIPTNYTFTPLSPDIPVEDRLKPVFVRPEEPKKEDQAAEAGEHVKQQKDEKQDQAASTTAATTTTTYHPMWTTIALWTTTAAPKASTKLKASHKVGDAELDVESTSGFKVGQGIKIDSGTPQEEVNIVTGFGSLILHHPLTQEHEQGATVEAMPKACSTWDTDNKTYTCGDLPRCCSGYEGMGISATSVQCVEMSKATTAYAVVCNQALQAANTSSKDQPQDLNAASDISVSPLQPPTPATLTNGTNLPPPIPATLTTGTNLPPPIPATLANGSNVLVPPPIPAAITNGTNITTGSNTTQAQFR